MTDRVLQRVVGEAAALAGSTPLADRVADRLRRLIRGGELPAGHALPAAGKLNAIGRVTALQVYRQLASEGLISMSPSRGSIVLPQPDDQHYVLIERRWGRPRSQYDYLMLNEILVNATYRGQQARLHFLDRSDIADLATVEELIPDQLRRDIEAGSVRGALMTHADHMPVVPEWLQRRGVPSVVFGEVRMSHCIDYDWEGVHRRGIDYLRARGCERIHVLATGRHTPVVAPDVTWDDCRRWPSEQRDTHAVEHGRRWTIERLEDGTQSDALFITDDLMGLGAVLELAGRPPEARPRILLAIHESQLVDAFRDCDLLVIRAADLVAEAVDLLESVRPCPPWQKRYVPFTLIPASKDPRP